MLSGLRNFIIVFLIALLGFGVIGHILANSTIPSFVEGNGDNEESSDVSNEFVSVEDSSKDESVSKESGETYSLAVLCVDLDKALASVFFVHTNDGYETCVYTSVSGKAPIENNGAQSTLSKIYADNGTDYLITKLKFVLGYDIDGYAVLDAVDASGKGRSITELATELSYVCNIKVPFNYPNPNYVAPPISLPNEETSEISEEGISEDISGDGTDNNGRFINIPAGSYALNGTMVLTGPTDKIPNYQVLLDSNYNIYAHEIYEAVLEKFFFESKSTNNFKYFSMISFDKDDASEKLFTDFKCYKYDYPDNTEAWNEAVAALRELELGENN